MMPGGTVKTGYETSVTGRPHSRGKAFSEHFMFKSASRPAFDSNGIS